MELAITIAMGAWIIASGVFFLLWNRNGEK